MICRSPYDAEVVEKLRRSGCIFTGKSGLDEFGMGTTSLYSSLYFIKIKMNDEMRIKIK